MNDNGSCNKKRKIEGCNPNKKDNMNPSHGSGREEMDALIKDIAERIEKFVTSSATHKKKSTDSKPTDMKQSQSQNRARIVQLKDELTCLNSIRDMLLNEIDEMIPTRLDELSSYFDDVSPLLALGHEPVSHIMGFLDEEELLKCEEASYTMNTIANSSNGPWEKLHKFRHRYSGHLPASNQVASGDGVSEWKYRPSSFDFISNSNESSMVVVQPSRFRFNFNGVSHCRNIVYLTQT